MNSKTFAETLVSKPSIEKTYKDLSTWTDKPLITKWTSKDWKSSWTCWTHFKNKQLVCKLYKYSSWNYYLHNFMEGAQMKYSYIQGQSA